MKNILTVLSSRYIVLDKKSIPMVAWNVEKKGYTQIAFKKNC